VTDTVDAPRSMVCTVDRLATEAALSVLDDGGGAVDAAIAANAVLTVTAPHMCGLGGDLFALVHTEEGAPRVLNASGLAGSGADAQRLRDEGHRRMPFRGDVRAVPVPGCVDGWLALHAQYGRRPLAEVLRPAIRLASDGFAASPLLAMATLLLEGVAGIGELAPPLASGARIRRPGVARTLAAIAGGGRDAFYGGEFGEGLLALGDGEYSEADLARDQAEWVEPIGARVHGHDVWTVPPNSQGYLTLMGLGIAEGLDLPEPDLGAWAHLTVEAARAAGYDRPDVLFDGADVSGLLAEAELDRRRATIDPSRRTARPGAATSGDTMYLCVVDGDTAVSLIQSNASGFGAHLAVGSTEVMVHNRGLGFSLEPGHRAEYGPGRRPPHTLSPALVTRSDGSFAACVGTMGGDQQPQILLQVITRLLRHGQDAGDAIGGPRWVLEQDEGSGFDTWADVDAQRVAVEPHAPAAWTEALTAAGHHVVAGGEHRFGHAHAVVAGPDGLRGAADARAVVSLAAGR
jgi:gamma-glutamyltranspeptidase/glutathione hydrolase